MSSQRGIPPATGSRCDRAAVTAQVELVPFPNRFVSEFFLSV